MSKEYKIPYINLEYDQEKLNERQLRWKKLQKDIEEIKNISLNDTLRLQPWVPISKETHTHFEFNTQKPWLSKNNEKIQNIILEEDDPTMDFTGVYMTHLNSDHDIDNLTNYKRLESYEYPGRFKIFGVSDNATQVKKYIDDCINVYQKGYKHANPNDIDKYFDGEDLIEFMQAMKEQNREYGFVLLLTPIVNEHTDSAGTWRWHKWGKYIGHHKIEHEYLNDEHGIDFVFVWGLHAVIKDDEVK